MIRSIEGYAVLEDETHITYKVIDAEVTGIRVIGILFSGIGGCYFALNGRKIHRGFDDRRIMGYIERHVVDGFEKRYGILEFLQ